MSKAGKAADLKIDWLLTLGPLLRAFLTLLALLLVCK